MRPEHERPGNENPTRPKMVSPLVDRLASELKYPIIDTDNLEEFTHQETACVLFFAGDPQRLKDTNDVAVVLPELVAKFAGAFRPGVVAQSAEKALQRKYGFRKWPALVFLCAEGYLGAISGIQHWDDYLQQIGELLAAEPSKPPSFEFPVAATNPRPIEASDDLA